MDDDLLESREGETYDLPSMMNLAFLLCCSNLRRELDETPTLSSGG